MKQVIDNEWIFGNELATERFERTLLALRLVYRPLVSAADGRVPAYEALARGADGAPLSALERTAGHQVGRRLRELAADAAAEAPVAALFVAVAPADLLDDELYDPTRPLGRVARRVVLQLEGRPVIGDVAQLDARVSRLRRLGFRLAVGDSGDGGLALAQLVWPDFVKIGRPVLDLIHQSPARQQVVADLCRLYHQVGMQVVADGVQSHADRATAAQLGCDLVQGPCFGAPVVSFDLAGFATPRAVRS
jgi:EAL domain-containing protein (putative c-di-GMP-specific phosphodiesterase class I)